jgi:mannose-6-phosphate isomerase-like protein (cupin superfamily)
MRLIGIVTFAALFVPGWAPAGWAQPSAVAMKTFASSAEVQEMIATAKKIRKSDQPTVSTPIVQLAPYRASLEYRASVGPAARHEKEAEIFYVIDGAATLVTGGKIANEKLSNPANFNGPSIDGGTEQAVAKGDFFIVPENSPHQFIGIKGALVLMSLHLPREAAK